MKYQALRPHFFSVVGWGGVGGRVGVVGWRWWVEGWFGLDLGAWVLVRDVVGVAGRMGGGMGDGGEEGGLWWLWTQGLEQGLPGIKTLLCLYV